MNKVILVGRLTRDPEVRYTKSEDPLCIASYTLAVDRKKKGEADFIRCKAFGRTGEFAERYFIKGMRVSVSGRIETGSYTNNNGDKVYTTDVVIEEQEFAQSRNEEKVIPSAEEQFGNGFDAVDQFELPFD